MKNPTPKIREDLDRIDSLLEQKSLFSLPVQERQTLREQSKGLREKFANIEGRFLTVGFLGGTGVGKSSLLNALARENIASSSFRRPHTERILVYRHAEADPLPREELLHIPWHEVTHRADAIQSLLLCDLPDFDSILTEHRASVMAFLEHLDLLVWVTSPEKYADRDFYDFLEQTPKARPYFTFVLNKLDLLLEPADGAGERIERVLKGFADHLKKRGMEDPLIFAVSAKDAGNSADAASWNQFHLFRRHLLEQRNIKNITAIKAANLEVAVQKLSAPLERERIHLTGVHGILSETVNVLKEKLPEWDRMGRRILLAWMEKRPAAVDETTWGVGSLVGPGYALGLLLSAVRGGRMRRVESPGAFDFAPPEETIETLKRPFHWLQERLHQRFLRENLPPRLWDEVRERMRLEDASPQLVQTLSATAEGFHEQKHSGLWRFRINQYLVYGLLTLCFLVALTGERAWRAFFNDPGFGGLFGLFAAGIEALFSPRGLAALLSYALIALFFAVRFYRSYARKLEAVGRRNSLRLAELLTRDWRDRLERTTEDLESLEKDVQERLNSFSNLWEKDKTF